MIPSNVGDQIHLKLGQSDQGTGLNEIESVLVVIGNVHIVADIVQQAATSSTNLASESSS